MMRIHCWLLTPGWLGPYGIRVDNGWLTGIWTIQRDTLGKSSGKSEWTTIGGGLSTAHRRSSLGNSGGWTPPTLPTRKKTMHIVRWSMFGQWTTLDLPDYPSIRLSHPKLCTYGDLLSFVPGLLTDIYHMFAARAEPARCGAPGNRGGFISI